MLEFLIKFFPAMIANSSPVIYAKLIPFHKPVNEKLFGKNKTWRGLILGSLSGGIVGHFIGFFLPILNFQIGLAMGFGALVGDLIKSFFKRRFKINEGNDWIPFDQIDWIIGGVLFSFYIFSLQEIILLFLILPFLHALTNKISYKFGLKR